MSKDSNAIEFTPEQSAAINHRGGSLLVSSAAGSGKTKVLVERLLGFIAEGKSIDRFLVITYTRAAASELRERIYEELHKRLLQSPGNRNLRRQTMLCKGAAIDTIHTFCSNVLRENAHLADLPPDFRIADGSECELVQNEVLNEMFSRTYEKINELSGLKALLDISVEGRNDDRLVQIVKSVYNKLKSIPDLEGWIGKQKEKLRLDNITDISKTDCGLYLISNIHRRVEYCYKQMTAIQEEMQVHADFKKAYSQSVDATTDGIKALLEALTVGWDEARAASGIDFPPALPVKGYTELKAIRNWCKSELAKCAKLIANSSADHVKDMEKMSPALTMLFDIVLEYDKEYEKEKIKRGVADFSDLEHKTLSLLYNKHTGKKTAIAKELSEKFDEILVDEYQDVNEVQELLFNAISKDGNNIFMVGDVKQSVYRFRLAEPAIFLRKYKEFAKYSSGCQEPVKINLSSNFRSRAGILETVNLVFRNIMSPELGEMEYTDSEALIPGRVDNEPRIEDMSGFGAYEGRLNIGEDKIEPEMQGKKGIKAKLSLEDKIISNASPVFVEIDLLSSVSQEENKENEAEDEEALDVVQREAIYVADRIRKIIDEKYQIPTKNGSFRDISCSDIAILMRSVKGKVWRYSSALRELGIATAIAFEEELFETVEVKAVMSLLSVIDNPMQDIPIAAVLSGPIYGFTSDELAEIRAQNDSLSYFEALKKTRELETASHETACKCKNVLADIEAMRLIAPDMPADRFIWHVYNSTGILNKVSAMNNGEKRCDNLILLAEYARNFEKNGYRGLFGFLTYIRGLQEKGIDVAVGTDDKGGSASAHDAVQILSIHKSKGLEFPVVFLAGTAGRHNFIDSRMPFVFHKELGVGGMVVDRDRRIKYTTLARDAIAEKLKSETLSEELRILYVAMTRAREKLIITASFTDAVKRYEKVRQLATPTGEYLPQALMSMGCFAEWLLAGTMGASGGDFVINWVECKAGGQGSVEYGAEEQESEDGGQQTGIGGQEIEMPDGPGAFEYKFCAAVNLPSKLTVTGLASISDSEAESADWVKHEAESAGEDEEAIAPSSRGIVTQPKFITKRTDLTPVQRGSLLHNVMRYIDFDICSNEDGIKKDLQRMVKSGLLHEYEVSKIAGDVSKIVLFFISSTGKRLLNASATSREFKFSLLTPAMRYYPNAGEEQILLQGVIDCYFEEGDELVIVDFKTDNIYSAEGIAEKTEKYTPQLEAYSEALERITGKRVKERIIYFFATNDAVSV